MSDVGCDVTIDEIIASTQDVSTPDEALEKIFPGETVTEDFIEEMMEEGSGSEEDSADDSKPVNNSVNHESNNHNDQPDGIIGYKSRRILLNRLPTSPVNPLPEGWIAATHPSGFPIYFHKPTRVVTWSRPYKLLNGRVHKHDIPIESIPCLHLKKEAAGSENLESSKPHDKGQQTDASEIESSMHNGDDSNLNSHPKVTIHNTSPQYISDNDFNTYLEKRFDFETRQIPQFRKWSQRREFNRSLKRKRMEEASKEKDSENKEESKGSVANLITLTVEKEDGSTTHKRKLVLNTTSKPMICVLHEYAQRVLKTQPQYIIHTRDDSAEPFEAITKLQDKEYGKAFAINKKSAKNKAALATLEMLIPGFKGQVESNQGHPDMKCFSDVLVSDPRVHELCTHTGQLLPYQLLTECLKRHQGVADTNISFDVQQGKRRMLNYTMMCGKYIVSGAAKNKKLGKQLAAQKILQQIHPEVDTWLELIDKYGTPMAHERAKRKREEQEIFDLKQKRNYAEDEETKSSSASSDRPMTEPNPELLAKLREMMFKLREQQEKKKARDEEDAKTGRKRLTPMAAAIAADRGLITSPEDRKLDDGSFLKSPEDGKPNVGDL